MINNLLGLAKINWLSTQKRGMMTFIVYIQPLFLLVIYSFSNPYQNSSNLQSFWFVVVNASVFNCWSTNVFSTISDIRRDRWTGVLDGIRYSPTSLGKIWIIRALTNTVHSCTSLLILIISSLMWYSPQISFLLIVDNILHLFFIYLLIGCFSIFFASIVGMSPYAYLIMNFIEYPVFIISGVGFSIGLLPYFLQWLPLMFPFGYMTELLRVNVNISLLSASKIQDAWWIVLLGTMVIILSGYFSMKKMNQELDSQGSLK